MPDTFRIITIGTDGRARLLEDLQVVDRVYRVRDTFGITPGAQGTRSATTSTRWGGSTATGEARENSTITATLAVKGPTPAAAASNVEQLLARLQDSQRSLYVEWRPDGLTHSAYSEIRGPAATAPAYRWVEWNGTRRVGIAVTWPVAPLPQALPLAIYERFDPPSDKRDTLPANLLPYPNHKAFPFSIAGGTSSTLEGAYDSAFGGRGVLLDFTTVSAGATQQIIDSANAASPRATVDPGHYYAVRARIKLRAALTSMQAQPLVLSIVFDPDGSEVTISSSLNAGAYSANAIIDFAGVVQAPATAGRIRLGIRMATNAGASGSLVYGQFMVREVAAATTPVPAYTDGEQEGYRWLGAPGASQTVQLEESELADYTSLTGLAPRIQRIDTSGLFQDFGSGGHGQSNPLPATIGGEYAHTAREPVPDGETLVAGRLETATASYSGFLTPGLRCTRRLAAPETSSSGEAAAAPTRSSSAPRPARYRPPATARPTT
jgi:hypothetical protein